MQSEEHHRQLWATKTEAAAQLNEASAAQALLQKQSMHAHERLAAAEARLQEERTTMQRQLAQVLSEKEATVQKLHRHLSEVCLCHILSTQSGCIDHTGQVVWWLRRPSFSCPAAAAKQVCCLEARYADT
jgi:hypothetical protein